MNGIDQNGDWIPPERELEFYKEQTAEQIAELFGVPREILESDANAYSVMEQMQIEFARRLLSIYGIRA